MNDLNFLIVEDNPSAALDLEIQIKEMGDNRLKIVDNSEDALQYAKAEQFDIVILDIFIKGKLDGLELATNFKKKNLPILLITSSDDPDIYQKARKLFPVGYLVKPFKKITLQSAVETALQYNGNEYMVKNNNLKGKNLILKDAFFIKQNNLLRKISFDSVLWIKTEGNYSLIYTKEKRYVLKLSLKKVLEQLPSAFFIQIQRAYIVPLAKIEDIDIARNEVIIRKEKLPLGRNYREELFERLNILK